jgi:hypothetical protein
MSRGSAKTYIILAVCSLLCLARPSLAQPVEGNNPRRLQRRTQADSVQQKKQLLLKQLGEKRLELAQILQAENPAAQTVRELQATTDPVPDGTGPTWREIERGLAGR